MRRIYQSSALRRDDEDSFTPNERRDDDPAPAAMRSVPGESLSRLLVPSRLAHRALTVTVETPEDSYPAGTDVPIRVTLRNRFSIPICIETKSLRLWTWDVDGAPEGSRLPEDLPDERRTFTFDRGERKQFFRRWPQLFKVTETEWEPATPGEYTIGARFDIDDAAAKGLADETVVTIRRE